MGMLHRATLVAATALAAAAGAAVACSTFDSADEGDAGAVGEAGAEAGADGPSSPPCGILTGAVEVLAPGEDAPSYVVSDGVYAYWARKSGGIRRTTVAAPHDTIDVEADAAMPSALVLTSGFVVYQTGSGIFAKDKQLPTSVPTPVYGFGNSQALVALTGDDVAFARSDIVFKKGITGAAIFNLARPQDGVFALAYAAPNVSFLGNGNAGIGVFTCGVDGGCNDTPGVLLADGQNGAVAVAADSTHVYFADESAGKVRRVAKTGGAPEDVITGVPGPRYVSTDDTHVYVGMQAGGIARAPKAGPLCMVTAGSAAVTSMSLFGDWIYFTDPSSVKRMHK
jgi:hypothetical protein